MRPRIAWYVHHHGRGHLGRLLAIAPHLDAEVLCFSSLPRPDELPANCTWMQLEADDTVEPGATPPALRDRTAGGVLHWAPLLHGGHRRRLTAIAALIDQMPVTAFVIDVSVEVALFARLLGVPTIHIAQPGRRNDEPHRLAFRTAARIIAPWPEELLRPEHLSGLSSVVYVGGISRFDGREPVGSTTTGLLVLGGAGGADVTASSIDEARRAAPTEGWSTLGIPPHNTDTAATDHWVADPWPAVSGADVVVSWAGQNSVADLAAADARAIVIPQVRPFEEQLDTARALERAGLAIVEDSWPDPDSWPELLRRARALRPDWARWRTSGAAERAASEIHAVARGEMR